MRTTPFSRRPLLGQPSTASVTLLLIASTAVASPPADLNVRTIDFNVTGVENDFDPGAGVYWNGSYYFAAHGDDGVELFVTDGTTLGTVQLADLRPGPLDADPEDLVRVGLENSLNSRIFFTAETGFSGREVWVTDGTTAGTHVVYDPPLIAGSTQPVGLTAWTGDLYYAANVLGGTWTLHRVERSDLSVEALGITEVFLDEDVEFVDAGSALYFVGNTSGPQIWSTTGGAPTQRTTLACTDIGDLFAAGPELFFVCETGLGTFLYQLDGGHPAGAIERHAEPPGTTIDRLISAGGFLYFVRNDEDVLAYENGVGTVTTVHDNPSATAAPDPLLRYDGSLLYSVYTSAEGRELWKATGTSTALVDDIYSGTGSGLPGTAMVELDGVAYFAASTSTSGRELWRTEGTAATTSLVLDLEAGPTSGVISGLTATPLGLFFGGLQPYQHLFLSDGTELGTEQLDDLLSLSGQPEEMTADEIGNRLFFRGLHPLGFEPAVSDGTVGGTAIIDLEPGPESFGFPRFQPTTLPAAGGRGEGASVALFSMSLGSGLDREMTLWATDGTVDGTEQLVVVGTAGSNANVSDGVRIGDQLLFPADDDVVDRELWTTDGTPVGTGLLVDLNPSSSGAGSDLTLLGGLVYFEGNDGLTGAELWRTDGTVPGTELVADRNPGPGSSRIDYVVASSNHLYFFDNDQYWVSDGTAGGTVLLGDIEEDYLSDAVDGDNVWMVGYDDFQNELWYATPTSFERKTDFLDDAAGGAEEEPRLLGVVNGRAVFWGRAGGGDGKPKLWSITPTTSAVEIAAFDARPEVEEETAPVIWDGWLWFRGATSAHGDDLWRTDGQIVEAVDLAPGPASSTPEWLTPVNDRLFLSGWDAEIKQELYVLWPSLPVFSDGFESGNTTTWSLTVP